MEAAGPPSILLQLAVTIIALLIVYGLMTFIDKSMQAYSTASKTMAVLVEDTTGDTVTIPQSLQSNSPILYPSSNQSSGIEFTYSCFLNISADTFSNPSRSLKHVFSKGTTKSFPLMAPGVFCRSDKNTLRVYMNTVDTWDNFVEVDNIPIAKWFHLVIILKGNYMDVYINGNVAQRTQFRTVPKINYGPVYVFNNRHFPDGTSVSQKDFVVDGAAKGMISRLQYFAYALNYSYIDSLYRKGPSAKMSGANVTELVPYMTDTWWTNQISGDASPTIAVGA